MTLTYSQISQELYPAFMQLIQAQNAGLVRLPQKVAYAFGKSFSEANKHAKEHAKLKNELLNQYAQVDESGQFKTVKTATGSEYDFKEGAKQIFIDKAGELGKTEISCKFYPISRAELEKVDNFPIQIFPILEEYGLITDLHLETPKLHKVLN